MVFTYSKFATFSKSYLDFGNCNASIIYSFHFQQFKILSGHIFFMKGREREQNVGETVKLTIFSTFFRHLPVIRKKVKH